MSEKIISIESYHPLDIFGVNDQNIEVIRDFYPKLKIIARDNNLKAYGEEADLLGFEEKVTAMLLHYDKFGRLTREDIRMILDSSAAENALAEEGHNTEVIVHGRNGMLVRARTPNQRAMVTEL